MAIVSSGPGGSGSASGSVGSLVFAHNKGGQYVRNRSTPTNPNSSRQQDARSVFGTHAAGWSNTLSQAQRDQWDTYAQNHTIKNALGNDIKISGLSWYCMLNSRLSDAGQTVVAVPPAVDVPAGFDTLTVTYTSATAISVAYAAALAAGESMQIWCSLPKPPGSSPNFKQCRLIGYSALAGATPIAFTLPFTIQDTQECTFFARRMDGDGQVSVLKKDKEVYTV